MVAAAYSINIHPHPRYLGQALADFVEKVESLQFFIDCNIGYTVANGTELARTNRGCRTGYADVHLEWLQETGVSLESPLNYPLTQSDGECQNDILSNIVKREVRFCLF